MDAGLSTSRVLDTGLQARDVHTNVSEDRAADFLLEVRIIWKLRGGSSKTISAGHYRRQRCDLSQIHGPRLTRPRA